MSEGIIQTLLGERNRWLSLNGEYARLGRAQFRTHWPQFRRTTFPRVAEAPRKPVLDENGIQRSDPTTGAFLWTYPGFPLEQDLYDLGWRP